MTPLVRCRHCNRARQEPGEEWRQMPRERGEITGGCRTCMDLIRVSQDREWYAVGAQLLRDRRRGYGPAPEGTDEFKGFREGDEVGNWRDSIPSKWLKASDLEGKPRLVTIKKFTEEKLQGETFPKPAVWFREEEKALILNITNGKKIEQILGTGDPDKWPGKRIVIYPTETELRGETVDCIRVRAPKAGAKLPPPPPAPEEVEDSEENLRDDYVSDDDGTPF